LIRLEVISTPLPEKNKRGIIAIMPSQIDIFRSANILLKQHGSAAENHAQQEMEKRMVANDAKGAAVWLAIMSAINDLTLQKGILQ
jgi:hypothetical protein